jgi:hypothetical protein
VYNAKYNVALAAKNIAARGHGKNIICHLDIWQESNTGRMAVPVIQATERAVWYTGKSWSAISKIRRNSGTGMLLSQLIFQNLRETRGSRHPYFALG